MVFAPDGKQIALEGGRRIEGDTPGYEEVRRLVDIASGKELRRFKMAEGDGDQVLAATPDGKYLLSLGNLGVLRIEEMATGTEVLEQKFPRDNSACAGRLAGRQDRGRLDRSQYQEAVPVGVAGGRRAAGIEGAAKRAAAS